jgi:hypothetical protein
MKIKRHRKGDAWIYEDTEEAFAMGEFPLRYDFDLVAFDDWLEGPGWKEAQRQAALDLRQQVIKAYATGNEVATVFGTTLLRFTQHMNAREAVFYPLARKYKEVEHLLPQPGESRTVYMPKKATTLKRRQKYAQIAEMRKEGKSNEEIAAQVGYSARHVGRIK